MKEHNGKVHVCVEENKKGCTLTAVVYVDCNYLRQIFLT